MLTLRAVLVASSQSSMSEQVHADAANGEEKKKAEAITIRVKDQVCGCMCT